MELDSDDYFPVSMKEEWEVWTAQIGGIMSMSPNHDLWIDQTTIGHGALAKLLKAIAGGLRPTDKIIVHVMDKPLALCMKRNGERDGFKQVPEKTMTEMHKRFKMEPLTLDNVRIIADEFNIPAKAISVKFVR